MRDKGQRAWGEARGTANKRQGIKKVVTHLSFSFFVLLFFLFSIRTNAQTFAPERITAWGNAGLTTGLSAPENQVSILDHGGDNTGVNNNSSAYAAALSSLNGEAGTIYFPEGNYLFTTGISIPDSVFLKGESTATVLHFNLGGNGDLIRMNGSIISTQYAMAQDAIKATHEIILADASEFAVGDVIRLYQFDEDHMFSSWAYGTLGQVVEIAAIDGNTVSLADPLNHNYPLSRNPYIQKLNARRGAGIECLKIVREDASTGQTDNIQFNYAFNCVIRNVEMENCNFAHISINSSAHIQVEGCYIHHAFAYGGGGQGYGVVAQVASSFCLTQNNVFNHMRHSMLIQSGANGNVFGYNYSYDPFWQEPSLPANSSGDAVLHGNYTYMNLFEGNTVQNIVVDASHANNGPYNTFFRNRAKLYGFFSDNTAPATDSMNVVGNEITNSGFPLGLFILSGAGYYSFGNNVSGTVNPSGTSGLTINSLYLNENALPGFMWQQTLPMVGYPLAMNAKLLPAEERFIAQEYVDCSILVTSAQTAAISQKELFKLNGNSVECDNTALPATLRIYSLNGALVRSETLTSTREVLSLPKGNGMFLIRIESKNGVGNATFKYVLP